MKVIHVMETATSVRTLYAQVRTPNQRALLGYIIRKGFTDDYVMLGALALLREIEKANSRQLVYQLCLESTHAKEIINLAELAQQGAYNQFKLSKADIKKCIRLLSF